MSILKLRYNKNNLSKWWLAVVLLLSVSVFSGYSSNSNSLPKQTAQTEILCSIHKKSPEQTASYKRLFYPDYKTRHNEICILLHYNRQAKIKLSHLSKDLYSLRFTARFIQIKAIPPTSTEDNFPSITG
jgi:hypothetical protein